MSQLNKKILVSGCGLSWSIQECRTWVNILKVLGLDIVDVGGPAISNQTILNRTFEYLLSHSDISTVIVQLTYIGKLDVEVDDYRKSILVDPDPVRNFVQHNIWPSSSSQHHISKQLWVKWLHSPVLEIQDLCYKLILLKHWCDTHNIQLVVEQGYSIDWSDTQKNLLAVVPVNFDLTIDEMHKKSNFYVPLTEKKPIPNIKFQIELSEYFLKRLGINLDEKIKKMKIFYSSNT